MAKLDPLFSKSRGPLLTVPLHAPSGLTVLQLPLSYLSFLPGNSASRSRTYYSPGIGGGFQPTSFILLPYNSQGEALSKPIHPAKQ